MKVSYQWLSEFVEIPWKPEELAERLTMAGLEIEALIRQGAGIESIVVAEILKSDPHPNADRLSVCEVSTGERKHQIVCGAKNYKVGDKVPLALPGTRLPSGMEIQSAKLRGVPSEGMLCSAKELALAEDAQGLLILPAAARAGQSLIEALGLDDTIIDVEVTPNRPDLLSHLGIAREIATLAGVAIKPPQLYRGKPAGNETFAVEIRDPVLCPRYSARVLRNVKVGPSPEWLQRRLAAVGQRPINNVVDVTNYVMLELGQPLHAFDTQRLEGRKIIVRRADQDEKIRTLDGTELKLDPDVLVIADSKHPVALAGVMGGIHSGIEADTTEVLIESATFAPSNIRRTSKKFQIRSESSYRFERGIDPLLAAQGSDLCTRLLAELAGAQAAGPLHMVEPVPTKSRTVSVRNAAITRMAGRPLPEKEIENVLTGLGFTIREISFEKTGLSTYAESGRIPEAWTLEIPSYRLDVAEEVDLLEEIVRIYGIERLPAKPPCARWISLEEPGPYFEHWEVREICRALGLDEIQNYTLVSAAAAHQLHGSAFSEDQILANPLNAGMDSLRADLFMGILDTAAANHSRRNLSLALFEIGRVFEGRRESTHLGLGLGGEIPSAGWEGAPRQYDFFDLKGRVTRVLEELAPGQTIEWKQESHKAFSVFITLYRGSEEIGFLGQVSPSLLRSRKIEGDLFFAELDLDLLASRKREDAKLRPLPLYPAVQRDLALVLDESLPFRDIERALREIAEKSVAAKNICLESLALFDIFQSSQLGGGKKSIAFRFVYRSLAKTLTDTEINALHAEITAQVIKKLRCEVRA